MSTEPQQVERDPISHTDPAGASDTHAQTSGGPVNTESLPPTESPAAGGGDPEAGDADAPAAPPAPAESPATGGGDPDADSTRGPAY